MTRGRPPQRTERWFALLCLMHGVGQELAGQEAEIRRRRSERRLRPTARRIAGEEAGLADKTVTNALAIAIARGLFSRYQELAGRPLVQKTSPVGSLTEDGYRALGPPSASWRAAIGAAWGIPTGTKARVALKVLRAELDAEAQGSRDGHRGEAGDAQSGQTALA